MQFLERLAGTDLRQRKYQPEIDGLRAIAVLSVVLYHLGIYPFTGGFVGVDVFFVISGYLITRLILTEVASGTFTFSGFYIRRARRLFPAFFVTASTCLVAGALLLNPSDLQALAESTVYSVLSISNFYFWSIADYFDTAAEMKPLLHTWSLSVEEQFYLFLPLTLVALWRIGRWAAPVALVTLSIGSLVLANYWLAQEAAATAFYMLPARVFEFGVGAALVWLRWRSPNWLLEAALLAAICLIAVPAVTYTEETIFPGTSALIPCIGAALAIYAGSARYSGWLLRNPISIWIGKISYSAYLVHWPLVVFFQFFFYRKPSPFDTIVLIGGTFVLAWLMYKYIEQPFRRERPGSVSRPAFSLTSASLAVAIVAPSFAAWATEGFPDRVPPDRHFNSDRQELKLMLSECGEQNSNIPESLFSCQLFQEHPNDLFIFGDSHARHHFVGLKEEFQSDYNLYMAFKGGCLPQRGTTDWEHGSRSCARHNQKVMTFLREHPPSVVVISNAIRGSDPEALASATMQLIDDVESLGHRAIYIGDIIRPERYLTNCHNVPAYVLSDVFVRERCIGDPAVRATNLAFNAGMKNVLSDRYISASDVQCPNGQCSYHLNGRPMFRDNHHLTLEGSRYIIKKLRGQMESYLYPEVGLEGRPSAPR